MKAFLSTWWERIRTSYLALPGVMTIVAIGLSALTLHIDTNLKPEWARNTAWIWAGGAEGARNVLATISSSTITVAGVVFSITIVTLTLASSQFGPRLLRNFLGDRGTQLVLGVFVSTFVYCLLVLRAVRGTNAVTVVPYLSVTCGVAFAVASVGFLIYFIHHIATSILAENLIARVATDLRSGIDELYPDALSEGDLTEKPGTPEQADDNSAVVTSKKSGFIQAISLDDLLQLAEHHHLVIHLRRRPGNFTAEDAMIALVSPAERCTPEIAEKIQAQFFFGRQRTPTQDIEYSIDQLVEVGVRALSPGINDPFTAMTVAEWLGASLVRVAQRKFPSRHICGKDGKVRIVTDATDFSGIANTALNQLRQYGRKSVAVVICLLQVLERIGPHLKRSGDREVLCRHALLIRDDGLAATPNESDRSDINNAFAAADRSLSATNRPNSENGS